MINPAYRDGDTDIKENVCKRLTPPVIEDDEEELRVWNAEQCKKFFKRGSFST